MTALQDRFYAATGPVLAQDLRALAALPLPWGDLEGRRVLVTGAYGFLGSFLVHALVHLRVTGCSPGLEVVALGRSPERARERLGFCLEEGLVSFVAGDVAREPVGCPPVDYVVHAASHASPVSYCRDPAGTMDANLLGTRWALELARRSSSRRLLFVSSSEVYGRSGDAPLREGDVGLVDPLSVRSCYAESKRAGETMCVAWHQQFGVPAVVVRPFHTYGPGMRRDDGRVFADFVFDALEGRDLRMLSDGSARRAFCYAADAVAGFLTVLLTGCAGEAYNVGNPAAEASILELAELVASLAPGGPVRVVRAPRADDGTYVPSPVARNRPDVSKLGALGWAPWTDLREGFSKTLRSYS